MLAYTFTRGIEKPSRRSSLENLVNQFGDEKAGCIKIDLHRRDKLSSNTAIRRVVHEKSLNETSRFFDRFTQLMQLALVMLKVKKEKERERERERETKCITEK